MSLDRSTDRVARKKPRTAPAIRDEAEDRGRDAMQTVTEGGMLPAITVETLLYVAAVVLGLAVRLFQLDAWPLSASESHTALAAWLTAQGYRPDTWGMSSLLVYGTALGFLPLAVSDTTARLVPALLGSLLVGLPWFLRDRLGRAGALVASLILALSPSFLFFSRSLDGGIVTAAGGLGLLVCALRYVERPRPAWLYAGAACVALLVMGDGSGWATLAVLGTGLAWLTLRGGGDAGWRDLAAACKSRRLLGFLAALLLLISTGLLTNLGGLQHGLLDPLLGWLGGIMSGAPARPWSYYIGNLLAYEPLLVVFSILAVVLLVYDTRPRDEAESVGIAERGFLVFLSLWALTSLVWTTVGAAKPASAILHATLPLALLAGWAIGRVVTAIWQARLLAAGGLALAWTYFVMLLAGAALTNPVALFGGRFETLERQIQLVQAAIIIALFAGLIAMAVWLARGIGPRGALLSLSLTVLVVLSVFGAHSAWTLAFFPKNTEPLVPEATTLEMRTLVADLTSLARFTGESGTGITLEPSLAYPALWYLRDYRQVTLDAVTAAAKTPVVIVTNNSDVRVQPFVSGYEGRKYRVGSTWMPVVLPEASLWNWLANRVALSPSQARDVVMYIKH